MYDTLLQNHGDNLTLIIHTQGKFSAINLFGVEETNEQQRILW